MEPAPAIVELVRRTACKIHAAILAVQKRRECGNLVILRLRLKGSCSKSGQRLNHQRRARAGQRFKQVHRSRIRTNFDGLLQKNRPRVQALFQQHGRVSREGVAHGNGPLNRRRAAVFWQQRAVQIDAAQPRQHKHPRRNNAPIGHNNNRLRGNGFKLRAELRVISDLFRLRNSQSRGKRRLLHGRCRQLLCSPHGPVRLRDHQCNFMTRRKQRFERRNSKAGSAAKHELHSHSFAPLPLAFALQLANLAQVQVALQPAHSEDE